MRCRRASTGGPSMRSPPAKTYGMLALGAIAALAFEVYVGFARGLNPGWENGWSGGLSIHRVWSAGMTCVLLAIEMTVGLGLGALTCLLLCRFATGRRHAGLVLVVWLVACIALAMLTSSWLYYEIHTSTLDMWPNGYLGGGK